MLSNLTARMEYIVKHEARWTDFSIICVCVILNFLMFTHPLSTQTLNAAIIRYNERTIPSAFILVSLNGDLIFHSNNYIHIHKWCKCGGQERKTLRLTVLWWCQIWLAVLVHSFMCVVCVYCLLLMYHSLILLSCWRVCECVLSWGSSLPRVSACVLWHVFVRERVLSLCCVVCL